MQSTHITMISNFKSIPTRSFLIRHSNFTFVPTGTTPPFAFGTIKFVITGTAGWIKQCIQMIFRYTTFRWIAPNARERRHTTASIDNDRLTLRRWLSTPQIRIMGPIPLKQMCDLHFRCICCHVAFLQLTLPETLLPLTG